MAEQTVHKRAVQQQVAHEWKLELKGLAIALSSCVRYTADLQCYRLRQWHVELALMH